MRILDQIDRDLVQLALIAERDEVVGDVDRDGGTQRGYLLDPVRRAVHHIAQPDALAVAALRRRVAAQVVDDVARALGPLQRAVDHRIEVLHHPVEPQLLPARLELGAERVVLAPAPRRIEERAQALRILAQRVRVRVDRADRIVQLVRDAGDQAAERRELFRLNQLLLRPLQLEVRVVERIIGTAQLADRPSDQHDAGETVARVVTRGAVHRQRRAAVPAKQIELAIGDDFIARSMQQAADQLGILRREQRLHRPLAQVGFGDARQFDQRLVRLLHAPLRVANDQHVEHRRQHAGDEGMRFLERAVLVLEIDFVLDEVGIDLVHLADNVDPCALAQRSEIGNLLAGDGMKETGGFLCARADIGSDVS